MKWIKSRDLRQKQLKMSALQHQQHGPDRNDLEFIFQKIGGTVTFLLRYLVGHKEEAIMRE